MNESAPALAVAMILASAALHAVISLLWKSGGDLLARRAVVDIASSILVLPAAFFLPPPGDETLRLLAISLTIHMVYLSLFTAAFTRGDLSLVYPIARGIGPLATAVFATLALGETLTPLAVFGLVLASTGVMGAASSAKLKDAAWAIGLAAMVGLTMGGYTTTDAAGVRSAENPLTYVVWLMLVHGPLFTSIAWSRRGKALFGIMKAEWRGGAIAGALSVVSYGLALLALDIAPATEIAALRETSVVFAAFLGWFVLGERMGARRLIAAAVLATGLVVLRMG